MGSLLFFGCPGCSGCGAAAPKGFCGCWAQGCTGGWTDGCTGAWGAGCTGCRAGAAGSAGVISGNGVPQTEQNFCVSYLAGVWHF